MNARTTIPKLPRNRWLVGTTLLALAGLVAACGGDDDQAASAEVEAETATDSTDDGQAGDGSEADSAPASSSSGSYTGSYTLVDEEFGTMVNVTVDGSTRTIETNALPDHDTGEFPNDGNPNEITEQDLTWEFPVEATYTGEATDVRTSGVAVNGVKFEPGTAETLTCDSGETYRIEALQDVYDLGLDFNNAHVQPTGEYHYHGISELLVGAYEVDDDLVHVGFAADGHLMYYSKSGAYESGYELSSSTRTGTGCTPSGPFSDTIDVEGSDPDGTYTADWVFDESNGDLDSCNGTTIDGQYVYLVTDGYPYVTRCLNGDTSGVSGIGGGPGGGAPTGGDAAPGWGGAPGQGPDPTETAEALGTTQSELMVALPTS